MKVLVTGAAGYIGSHTAFALLQAGYDVVALDNYSNSSPISLQRVGELAKREPTVIECDCGDSWALTEVFDEHSDIEAVLHFAAFKAVGESTERPLDYYRNNVSGSIALLQVMEEFGVRDIVFSSSCTVYGEPEYVPIDEKHSAGNVSSPYGRTKFVMESVIKNLCESNSRWNAAILRYFNPIGAHPSGEIGEDPLGVPENLVPFVCQVASGKIEKLRVFGNDYPTRDGTAIRDYVHVLDLAEAHLSAMEKVVQGTGCFVCNLGTGRGSTVQEVVSAFEAATGERIDLENVERRPGDVSEAWADPSFAKDFLGWESKRGLEEALADAWRWQSKNPQGYGKVEGIE